VYFLENANLPVGEYRRNALQNKIKAVIEVDRAAMLSYLTGQTDTCAQIDPAMQASFASASSRSTSSSAAPSILKRPAESSVDADASNTSSLHPEKLAELRELRKQQKRRVSESSTLSEPQPSTVVTSGHNIVAQLLQLVPAASKEGYEEDKAVVTRVRGSEYAPYSRHSTMNASSHVSPACLYKCVICINFMSLVGLHLSVEAVQRSHPQAQDRPRCRCQ
jgi:hypothetical protein